MITSATAPILDISIYSQFKSAKSRQAPFTLDVKLQTSDYLTVLFGHSASGKTLTLQSIAGLVRPQQGHIKLHGQALFDAEAHVHVPPRHRHIGYMFQDYALFPHLTVRKNIAFGLSNRVRSIFGLSAEVKKTIHNLLDFFQIAHIADRYPHEISGGQRQRVALARAIAIKPKLLLLDEPFSALDPLLRMRLRSDFTDLMRHFGIPSIIITHDPEDVDAFAETLFIYHQGTCSEALNFQALRQSRPTLDVLMDLMRQAKGEI